ncbi:MAG: hypothetical protein RLZZ480_752, partial [Candidatus Parcubacteria bacterium]
MATLVFDIETVGEAWETFDDYTKKSLLGSFERRDVPVSSERELQNQLGLSPFTGSIVSVAMYDIERRRGAVYFVSDVADTFTEGDFVCKCRTEKEILEDFWEGARSYDVFVSFNGRAFDVPFLIHRSLAHDVTPSVSFSQSRYVSRQQLPYHVDLMDEFSFYGAMSKRPSLHLLCRTYGIESKKSEVDGSQVAGRRNKKKIKKH